MPLDLNGVTLGAITRCVQNAFTPAELFAAGEQGAWYDPSDLNTLFQDAAGTTPVTAAGQQVGLMLDKSKGLTLGSELVTNGDFSSGTTGWTTTNGTGSVSGNVYTLSPSSNGCAATQLITGLTVGVTYRVTVVFTSANLNNTTGINISSNSSGSSILAAGTTEAGARTATLYWSASATQAYFGIRIGSTGSNAAMSSISVRAIPGNHAFQYTSLNRPTLQTSGGVWYLDFDGSNDSMATASIDFTATDEMSVFAGVTKDSDAAVGHIAELSSNYLSNNGSFLISGPDDTAAATYGVGLRSSATAYTVPSVYASPITNVLAVVYDISGASVTAEINSRVNGVLNQSGAGGLAGTGNFGNYPLYIGARGGSSLFFNGRLYSLIVLGRTATAGEITSTEQWVAGKTGITI